MSTVRDRHLAASELIEYFERFSEPDPPAQTLNLYLWRGKGVLENYGTGRVFALAEDVEAARAAVKLALREEYDWMDEGDFEQEFSEFTDRRFSWLNREPEVIDLTKPATFLIQGSE